MSGRGGGGRAQLSLLDRLIDDAPETLSEAPLSAAETLAALRRSVRRDLEALLNARRRWRSWPAELAELETSPIGFGLPDYASGAFNDVGRRQRLCRDIEQTIRRFEPRFASVSVSLLDTDNVLESTLHLRIEALLHAEPAPEPISFDTMLDATTADVTVHARDV